MNWLKNKLREWLGIDSLQSELNNKIDSSYHKLNKRDDALFSDYAQLEGVFNKHTRTDIDLNLGREGSYIIISGKWRNNDHVEVIRIDSEEFDQVMGYVKDIRKWNGKRNYRADVPYQFRWVF